MRIGRQVLHRCQSPRVIRGGVEGGHYMSWVFVSFLRYVVSISLTG